MGRPVTSRRSCLSVPGGSERALAKAATLPADEVVLDLEDAVAHGSKDSARALVVRTLTDPSWRGGAVAVRVNCIGSPWCHLDITAVVSLAGGFGSIVVPKVESPADLAFVDRLLDGLEAESGRERPLRIQALVETAAGLARVREIAGASGRLDALILGYADLAASLGRSRSVTAALDSWLPAQEAVLVAARMHGLQAIDGPFLGTKPDEDFVASAERGRDLGFDGKWAIHPSQIEVLNERFSPTPDEIARAREVLSALEQAASRGHGALELDGEMIDRATAVAARQTLARMSSVQR